MYPVSAMLETERCLLDPSLLPRSQFETAVLLDVPGLTIFCAHWLGCAH
jgi:hypothetical protein